MWSPFYHYFELRVDDDYSSSVDAVALIALLQSEFGITKKGEKLFELDDGILRADFSIDRTADGSYSSEGRCPYDVNIIPVVGSKQKATREKYVEVLVGIAKRLGWMLCEEVDEEGHEDVVLWAPE